MNRHLENAIWICFNTELYAPVDRADLAGVIHAVNHGTDYSHLSPEVMSELQKVCSEIKIYRVDFDLLNEALS